MTSSSLTIQKEIVLATAIVTVVDPNGQETICRTLLDNGSQSNFISSNLCNLLNLRKKSVSIPVSGINQNLSVVKYKTFVKIQSRISDFSRELEFLVLHKITGLLPSQ